MTLIRFKNIRSTFHPDSGTSFCGDKCHKLNYLIHMFKFFKFLGSMVILIREEL